MIAVAALIELPSSSDNGPEFVFQVSCSGSEKYFNECVHEVPANGVCDNAAMLGGKSSSKGLHILPPSVGTVYNNHNRSTKMCICCNF